MLLPGVDPLTAIAVEDPRVGEWKPAPPGRQRQEMKPDPPFFAEDPAEAARGVQQFVGTATALTFLSSHSLRNASRPWPLAPAA